MQNSILKQAKGADCMEQAAQVERQPVWWDNLQNEKFYLQENFWSLGTKPVYIHHPQAAF